MFTNMFDIVMARRGGGGYIQTLRWGETLRQEIEKEGSYEITQEAAIISPNQCELHSGQR